MWTKENPVLGDVFFFFMFFSFGFNIGVRLFFAGCDETA